MLFLPSVLNSKPSVNFLASDTEVLLKGEEIVVFGIAVDLFNRFSPNSSLSTVGAACILLGEDDAIDNLRFLEIGADFIENENRQEAEKDGAQAKHKKAEEGEGNRAFRQRHDAIAAQQHALTCRLDARRRRAHM